MGPSPGDDEDRVDADIVVAACEARRQLFGGCDHAPQSPFVERQGGGIGAGPLLHFDEGQGLAATGDQVDFAAADPGAPGENPPAVEAKPPGGDGFCTASTPFRLGAVQPPSPSSRARA